jgi:hypothetical protein
MNQSSTGHFIKVLLEGVISNRDGVGSWIELWMDSDYLANIHRVAKVISRRILNGKPSAYLGIRKSIR